jgi:hypothetical protein
MSEQRDPKKCWLDYAGRCENPSHRATVPVPCCEGAQTGRHTCGSHRCIEHGRVNCGWVGCEKPAFSLPPEEAKPCGNYSVPHHHNERGGCIEKYQTPPPPKAEEGKKMPDDRVILHVGMGAPFACACANVLAHVEYAPVRSAARVPDTKEEEIGIHKLAAAGRWIQCYGLTSDRCSNLEHAVATITRRKP